MKKKFFFLENLMMNQKNPQQFEIQNIIFLISLPILFLFIGCLYLIVKIITISIIKIIYRNFLIIQIYKKNLVSVWTTAREKKIILICKKNLNMFRNLTFTYLLLYTACKN